MSRKIGLCLHAQCLYAPSRASWLCPKAHLSCLDMGNGRQNAVPIFFLSSPWNLTLRLRHEVSEIAKRRFEWASGWTCRPAEFTVSFLFLSSSVSFDSGIALLLTHISPCGFQDPFFFSLRRSLHIFQHQHLGHKQFIKAMEWRTRPLQFTGEGIIMAG